MCYISVFRAFFDSVAELLAAGLDELQVTEGKVPLRPESGPTVIK
jgi:hypothetical protein